MEVDSAAAPQKFPFLLSRLAAGGEGGAARMCLKLRWCRGWELNPRPWDYETHALTTELPRQPNFDGTGRWERESIRLHGLEKTHPILLAGEAGML